MLATDAVRTLADVLHDAKRRPVVVDWSGDAVVPATPASSGTGPTRTAHETLGRTLQLLRGERQYSMPPPSSLRNDLSLVQMVAPLQPANASHLEAVQRTAGTLPAFPFKSCVNMGQLTTRHIVGEAVWRKYPCPILVRNSGERPPESTQPESLREITRRIASCAEHPRSSAKIATYLTNLIGWRSQEDGQVWM